MRKFTLITAFLLVAIALFAGAASAALVVTDTTLGSSTQDVGVAVSKTFTVTSTETTTVTGIALTSTADAKYNITFSTNNFDLAPNASQTVTVTGFASPDHDAVDSSLKEAAIQIGNIVASSGALSGSGALSLQIENKLVIDKVRISINGESEKSYEDGDEIDDLKPGDKLKITVVVENSYNDGNDLYEDVDFEDVTVAYDFDDSDFDDSSDDDNIDVRADKTKEVSFNEVDVEYEASGSYTLTITVSGRGDSSKDGIDFSGLHGQEIKIDVDIDRESHELAFKSATLSPSRLVCGAEAFEVRASIVNIGEDDEEEGAIGVEVPKLGLAELRDVDIGESDEASRTIRVALPENVKAGTYDVEVSTYWNGDILSNQKVLSLTVDPCEDAQAATATQPADTQPSQPQVVTTVPSTGTTKTVSASSGSDKGFFDSGLGIATLVVGIGAALTLIVSLVTFMVRKPR